MQNLTKLIWKRTSMTRYYASVASQHQSFDIVIVGGGIVGLALARALEANPYTSKSLRVALIEGNDLDSVRKWNLDSTQYSNRASSITPQSRAFLDRIGVWEKLDQSRIKSYYDMQVWDGITDARVQFNTENEDHEIATMVENLNLQSALLRNLNTTTMIDKVKVQKIIRRAETTQTGEDENNKFFHDPWPSIHLDNGEVLSARLLIGADGANSPVRKFAEIESPGWDYDTHAVVATLELDPTHANETAWQRFLPTGTIALLPLPDNYASLVWSTKPNLAKAIRNAPPELFPLLVNAGLRLSVADLEYIYKVMVSGVGMETLQDEIRWRHGVKMGTSLQEFSGTTTSTPPTVVSYQQGTVAGFPLKMRHADQYTGSRIALAGDAAHSVHPLSGQGLNLGLADVQALVQAISFTVQHGGDIGSQLQCLGMYSRNRYVPNNAMIGAVDKLHKLFTAGSNSSLVVLTRSLGLRAVNALGPLVKKQFMNAAGSV